MKKVQSNHEIFFIKLFFGREKVKSSSVLTTDLLHDHLLLDSAPNIGPLLSRWELDKFKNC